LRDADAVAFSGTPAAWQMLAGQWHGEYWMRPSDRHGIIAFTLTASTEQASGNVLMISDRFGSPYQGIQGGPILLRRANRERS
jgi:hypothetical protein